LEDGALHKEETMKRMLSLGSLVALLTVPAVSWAAPPGTTPDLAERVEKLESYISILQHQVVQLQNQVLKLESDLATETRARQTADGRLQNAIDHEATSRLSGPAPLYPGLFLLLEDGRKWEKR
jgi:uncharacterized protein YlxW (UPF0749 family)